MQARVAVFLQKPEEIIAAHEVQLASLERP